jgi:hypothetical protein
VKTVASEIVVPAPVPARQENADVDAHAFASRTRPV